MADSLTERYVAAVVRDLPLELRNEVNVELGASIADAIEAKVATGQSPQTAETEVLTELGDPAALANAYSDRPLYLLGPRYYLLWRKLLRLLLPLVPLCVIGAVALGTALAGEAVGPIIGKSLAAGFGAAINVCFWLTLAFVIAERYGNQAVEQWTPDQLPDARVQTGNFGRGDLLGSLFLLALVIAAILWDRFVGLIYLPSGSVSLLNPGLWPWWTFALVAIIVLEAWMTIQLYRHGRWNYTFAVANTVLSVLFLSWAMTLYGRGELANPLLAELLTANNVDIEAQRVLQIVLGFALVCFPIWSIIDGWYKARATANAATIEGPL